MPKYCSGCSMELKENSNFCDNCGSQITSEISPKKNKKIIAIAAIVVVVVIAIIAVTMVWISSNNLFDPLSNLGYSNTEHGFGLNPPTGWTTDTSGLLGTIVVFYAPVNDDFTENINILSGQLPSGYTLASYVELNQNQLETYFTDYNLLSSNPTTVNGMNAYEYVNTYTQGIFNIKVKQVFVEKNSKLIVLTYTANIDDYSTYFYGLEQCVNSLKIV